MGNAVFANRCERDIWIWSVDETTGSSAPIKVAGRSRYTEPFRVPGAGGVVFKVSNSDQIVGGAHTQFEYAISNDQLYYDLSFVDCAKGESASDCPGHAKGLAMYSPNDACGKLDCAPGTYCPKQAYYVDTPLSKLGIEEPVFGCGSAGTGMDLYMVICSENPQVLKRSIAGRLAVEF
ncbi:hypothetical protein K458DRAFT_292869 [Lentithecium fluviatile CBS 122367]|uniref:Uncharacterized protein n=1 Tax=Lentithecium fluviatile CBS 122367 TaxID=1168545 RepID=A0A6G1JFC2_9PLEO|nr:hypothetical protein K458DRAFT_292869 [Lentithecium fluviatile CBS 122367]